MNASRRWMIALAAALAAACAEPVRPAAAPETAAPATDAPDGPAPVKRKLSPDERTERSAAALHDAVQKWRAQNQTECPTAARLAAEKQLPPEASATDAWGAPFKVLCDDDATTIVSLGADGREGTSDDIRVGEDAPPAAAGTAPPQQGAAPPLVTPVPSGAFTASAVQAVVRSHTAGVRRACWDRPAASASGSTAPATAAVVLTLAVSADGSVQNATASGDEPVASCIAQHARTWTFPAPQAVTTLTIPFRFVRR